MVTPIRKPTKTDRILMKFYDEYNMILSIYNEDTYDVYEKVSRGIPKYIGNIERKAILNDENFKRWVSHKKEQIQTKKENKTKPTQ